MSRRPKPKTIVARKLRKTMTAPEQLLWQRLKLRDSSGLIFRRQHPLGEYILDFYCHRARLCVEVDGVIHSYGDHPARDSKRDLWLAEHGVETYRVPAAEVFKSPDDVADGVWLKAHELAAKTPHPRI